MNKKVCHMTSAHSRYDVRILEKECVSLASNGYDVTLIVNDDKNDEIYKNVKIVSTRFTPKNRLDRIINSKNRIYKKAVQIDADIYHFHDPELIQVGNKLKKLNKRIIFDSHEDVPEQIKDKKWIPKIIRNIVSKTYELYEKFSVKKYDAVISVTPHIVERFLSINPNSVMVTNYPIIHADDEIQRNPSSKICFAGGISEQWNHHKILVAIANIEEIGYLLAGNGTNKYMDMLKRLPAWNKVDYKGKVSHAEVLSIYSESIAGMAINYSNQVKDEGTLGNTKLFEYMAAKVPVICSNYKLWKNIVDKYECGICVNPDDVTEIKSAIEYILMYPEKAKKMGENGRKAVLKQYNWKTQENILLSTYYRTFNEYN